MKGRKRGCPVNIRNWLIYILDKATQEYVRIYGLTSLSREISSSTEDGSADTDVWEEPYVTKRSSSVSLEGDEVVDATTGEKDQGQDLLDTYAEEAGCEGDATLKFVDPYGHAWVADYVVGSGSLSAGNSKTTRSWSLSQVGEAEVLPYVQVSGVSLKDGDNVITTLEFDEGDPAKIISLAFTPENASNKRFKVSNKKRSVATVGNITENGFTITPVAVGETVITVETVNNTKTASITVKVNAAE